ncbi:MAG TPA: polysaccharide ABC transporter ATP-binding protein [Actinomycetota bacterium]|nr:polysaccharide ABC transporter ATP-binding protein [Actinomycetota bacterium]
MGLLLLALGRLRRGALRTTPTLAAIDVEEISKRFRVFREKPTSLKQRLLTAHSRAEDFWALREISLDVREGSTFGLIGHNGSGKTTLLKCIAGILRPTSGTIHQRGRLAALLELGAGFHPELTGRENVYLNASFLGLSRKETDAAYEGIVDFAELEEFMDNQVKFYSSGMLVRLGFAVAVHVEPDVLLIDEVLAVGDEAFQRKCLDRVRAFQREGRTIVLVTHALDTVREICDRAAMLHHGRLHALGAPDDVVREMRYVLLGVTDPGFVPEQGTREAEIVEVQLIRASGASDGPVVIDDPLMIQVDVRQNEQVDDLDVDFEVLDGATNHPVLDARTSRAGIDLGRFDKKRVRFRVGAFPYHAGKYWVTIGLSSRSSGHLYHVQTQRYLFEVVDAPKVQDRIDVPVHVEVEDL